MASQAPSSAAIYVQTNDAQRNEVVAFERGDEGALSLLGRYATGGRGTGKAHLPSASSVVLTDDCRHLLVVNAGSDDVSLFTVADAGLLLADRVPSGGVTPTSVAASGDLVYVLNNGAPNVTGFHIDDGQLAELEQSTRSLSSADADPAQVCFSAEGSTLVVTERGTDSISAYAIDPRGYAAGPVTIQSAGQTPYGLDFSPDGAMVVSEAFGGAPGHAAASSYALGDAGELAVVSSSVGDTHSEVCWVAISNDGRFAYVTNFGDGTVSSYKIARDYSIDLHDAVAGSTGRSDKGIRDEAITRDGRFLYAIDPDARQVFGWAIGAEGDLAAVGAFEGVPPTVAGMAAS
jgi:6-phosphogluconolactonase (cycloisomerase 2 family)